MSSTVSYIISVVLAVCFHAFVVGLLLTNWNDNQPVNTLIDQRYYIEATVVDENPHKAKKRKEEAKKAEKLIRRSAHSLWRKMNTKRAFPGLKVPRASSSQRAKNTMSQLLSH